MKEKIKNLLKAAFPYIAVILLWRLSAPFWNPAGILAIIPIFYFTFIKPVPWFVLFGALFCFLIDYKSDSVLFWTSMFCLFYAINGFQNVLDITRQKSNDIFVFMVFWGATLTITLFFSFTFSHMIRSVWLFLWGTMLYFPFSALAQRINNDR